MMIWRIELEDPQNEVGELFEQHDVDPQDIVESYSLLAEFDLKAETIL